MTRPEGYEGFYADAATEREAESEGRKVVREGRWFWPRMKCGCDTIGCYDLTTDIGCKECLIKREAIQVLVPQSKDTEEYILAGYVEKGDIPIDSRGAEYIYIVSEYGFDGCTEPIFVRKRV